MNIAELESIIDEILNRSKKLIREGRRDDILNERFFHHMFSSLVASHFSKNGVDLWESLLLAPEFPTQEKFHWDDMVLSDVEKTRKHGVGKGGVGYFDFAIQTEPPIFIEWKCPTLYKTEEIAEIMLKLLSQHKSHIKVFAAIITSSRTGRRDHMDAIRERLKKGFEFSLEVLNINNLTDKNLYVYVATITDNDCIKICWGNYVQIESDFA